MEWRDFIASLVDSLAWPASIAFIAWLLRRQLAALLDGPMTRLKLGPVEAEWDRTAREVAKSITPPAKSGLGAQIDRLLKLAETEPDAAVLESFKLVEQRLHVLAARADVEGVERMPARRLAEVLVDRGVITPASAKAVEGMAAMRNLAAHAPRGRRATASEEATEYVVLTQGTLFALESGPTAGANGG